MIEEVTVSLKNLERKVDSIQMAANEGLNKFDFLLSLCYFFNLWSLFLLFENTLVTFFSFFSHFLFS